MKGLFIITGLGIIAMLAEVFKVKRGLLPVVVLGVALALGANFMEWKDGGSVDWFKNMIHFDHVGLAFSSVILVTTMFWFILANDYFKQDSTDHFTLVLFATVGALMLTAFRNMTTLFLGIETLSIPLYVLAASRKRDLGSNEAGFKYLIMGSFASAFLLFGIALVYGATGTFDMPKLMHTDVDAMPMYFYVGVLMILVSLLFKVSAAPFHFWAPDVYEGSPTLVTAYMSTIVKTGAFVAILKLFMITLNGASGVWSGVLTVVIALSLIIANFSAAAQSSVKRMLAYSSISHAGFMLMVVLADVRSNLSIDAVLYYSLAYSIGSIAAFGVLYNVSKNGDETFDSFNGLFRKSPFMAICMTIAMLSMAGIPVTAGFFAKYFVFTAMIGTSYKWLLILAVVTSAIGAYYYLKVVIAMFFRESNGAEFAVPTSNRAVIVLTTLITLAIGIVPGVIAEVFRF